MTDKTDILAPIPMAPCQECLENPEAATDDAVIVWCKHRRFGALYIPVLGLWEIYGPLESDEQFRRLLKESVTMRARFHLPQH